MKEQRFPRPGKTLHWLGDAPDRKGAAEAQRRVQQPACVRQNGETSAQRVVATSLHSPARDMHLWCAQQLDAETQDSADRPRERTQHGCTETARRA